MSNTNTIQYVPAKLLRFGQFLDIENSLNAPNNVISGKQLRQRKSNLKAIERLTKQESAQFGLILAGAYGKGRVGHQSQRFCANKTYGHGEAFDRFIGGYIDPVTKSWTPRRVDEHGDVLPWRFTTEQNIKAHVLQWMKNLEAVNHEQNHIKQAMRDYLLALLATLETRHLQLFHNQLDSAKVQALKDALSDENALISEALRQRLAEYIVKITLAYRLENHKVAAVIRERDAVISFDWLMGNASFINLVRSTIFFIDRFIHQMMDAINALKKFIEANPVTATLTAAVNSKTYSYTGTILFGAIVLMNIIDQVKFSIELHRLKKAGIITKTEARKQLREFWTAARIERLVGAAYWAIFNTASIFIAPGIGLTLTFIGFALDVLTEIYKTFKTQLHASRERENALRKELIPTYFNEAANHGIDVLKVAFFGERKTEEVYRQEYARAASAYVDANEHLNPGDLTPFKPYEAWVIDRYGESASDKFYQKFRAFHPDLVEKIINRDLAEGNRDGGCKEKHAVIKSQEYLNFVAPFFHDKVIASDAFKVWYKGRRNMFKNNPRGFSHAEGEVHREIADIRAVLAGQKKAAIKDTALMSVAAGAFVATTFALSMAALTPIAGAIFATIFSHIVLSIIKAKINGHKAKQKEAQTEREEMFYEPIVEPSQFEPALLPRANGQSLAKLELKELTLEKPDAASSQFINVKKAMRPMESMRLFAPAFPALAVEAEAPIPVRIAVLG